jgi:hypothetical protein
MLQDFRCYSDGREENVRKGSRKERELKRKLLAIFRMFNDKKESTVI